MLRQLPTSRLAARRQIATSANSKANATPCRGACAPPVEMPSWQHMHACVHLQAPPTAPVTVIVHKLPSASHDGRWQRRFNSCPCCCSFMHPPLQAYADNFENENAVPEWACFGPQKACPSSTTHCEQGQEEHTRQRLGAGQWAWVQRPLAWPQALVTAQCGWLVVPACSRPGRAAPRAAWFTPRAPLHPLPVAYRRAPLGQRCTAVPAAHQPPPRDLHEWQPRGAAEARMLSPCRAARRMPARQP